MADDKKFDIDNADGKAAARAAARAVDTRAATRIDARCVAIVQARMGSTRLPGKVLAELGGTTMLEQVIRRLRGARRIHEIVIATSTSPEDDVIVREADRISTWAYRGSEADVLARYAGAARAYRAGTVVRVTADCPLLDPEVIDQVIGALTPDLDYASNTHARSFPRGLDVEAMHVDTLERIARMAMSVGSREHVTAFLMEAPQLFRTSQVRAAQDDSDLRCTVDTPDDLALVRELYDALALAGAPQPYRKVVEAVRARPELAAINAHVTQKPWQDPHVA
ncbi:MAG TPA: glycosyltransferase family protein [Kofleriaceae bacterium]